jgi:hypothetical protein
MRLCTQEKCWCGRGFEFTLDLLICSCRVIR